MSTQYPSSPGGVWPPPPTNTPDEGRSQILALLTQYRSPVTLTYWMIGFVAVTVLSDIFEALATMSGRSGGGAASIASSISSIAGLVAGILFLVWTYRLYKNLGSGLVLSDSGGILDE